MSFLRDNLAMCLQNLLKRHILWPSNILWESHLRSNGIKAQRGQMKPCLGISKTKQSFFFSQNYIFNISKDWSSHHRQARTSWNLPYVLVLFSLSNLILIREWVGETMIFPLSYLSLDLSWRCIEMFRLLWIIVITKNYFKNTRNNKWLVCNVWHSLRTLGASKNYNRKFVFIDVERCPQFMG